MMWYRSYREHVIMPFPSFDTATSSWAPQANISWVSGPIRESAFVRFPTRVASESEAVECALTAAKTWIDTHKRASVGQWDPARDVDSTSIAGTTIVGLLRKGGRQGRRLQPDLAKDSGKLSFDDFKANLASLGANAAEPVLLKSYVALNKLRKSGNYSWAQIRSKLKRSQEQKGSLPENPRAKTNGLPLTAKDWRRI